MLIDAAFTLFLNSEEGEDHDSLSMYSLNASYTHGIQVIYDKLRF